MGVSYLHLGLLTLAMSLLFLPLHSIGQAPQLVPELETFSGVYLEELATPSTFYSTVAPLVFGFQVPSWSREDMLLPLTNCTSPDAPLATCAVLYYMPQVQSLFSELLFNGQPLVNRLQWMKAAPQVSDIQFKCHQLGKHFRDIFVSGEVMDRYLEKLKDCSPAGEMEYFKHLTNYDYNISSVYRQMRGGFYREVWLKVSEGRIDIGLWINAQTILSSLLFFNYYVELSRWQNALIDCESGRIPTSLITPELMEDTLQDLYETVAPKNLQPVISAPDVGNYLKNDLTDCTFSNDTLYVRILIPLLPKAHSYSLYNIRPAVFYRGDEEECQLEVKGMFVLDNMDQVAYDTDCTPNTFCHVDTLKRDGKVNPCASAILNGHWSNVVKFCAFKCVPVSEYHFQGGLHTTTESKILNVDQVGGNKLLVTGIDTSREEFIIKCPGGREQKVPGVSFGALEVTLPCGCSLMLPSNSTFSPNKPNSCGQFSSNSLIQGGKVRQLVPLHWIRDVKLLPHEVTYAKVTPGDVISLMPRKDKVGTEIVTSTTSGGVEFLLVLYFIVIVGLCVVVGLLMWRLKKMGVCLDLLDFRREHNNSMSYNNLGGSGGRVE